jgi:hypothetical protein
MTQPCQRLPAIEDFRRQYWLPTAPSAGGEVVASAIGFGQRGASAVQEHGDEFSIASKMVAVGLAGSSASPRRPENAARRRILAKKIFGTEK